MSEGICIFAYNNKQVDYAKLATISAWYAKKNLNRPVVLITDQSTIDWMISADFMQCSKNIFDDFIITDRPKSENERILHDNTQKYKIPFINENRSEIFDLSPFDNTLLIDSDYLIFSDRLNEYWKIDSDFMISQKVIDIDIEDRFQYYDRYVSETSVFLDWATTILFKKSKYSRLLFDQVNQIRNNYQLYADIYRFDSRIYRNDTAFSISKHILNGFTNNNSYRLPDILTSIDKDEVVDLDDQSIKILISEKNVLTSLKNIDVHIMNKLSLIRMFDKFREII